MVQNQKRTQFWNRLDPLYNTFLGYLKKIINKKKYKNFTTPSLKNHTAKTKREK